MFSLRSILYPPSPALFRHLRSRQHIPHHAIRIQPFQLRLRPQHQPMPQHRQRRLLHIIGNHKVPLLPRRKRLRHHQQSSATPRLTPQRNRRPSPSPPHHRQQIIKNRRLNPHSTHLSPRRRQQLKRNSLHRR